MLSLEKWKERFPDPLVKLEKITDPELTYDAYSDEAYLLVGELAEELSQFLPLDSIEIQVNGRFGELIFGIGFQKSDRWKLMALKLFRKLPRRYYGFRVYYYIKRTSHA